MSRTWLLITVSALLGLAPQRSIAQASATAPVRARVKPAPTPPALMPPLVPSAAHPRMMELLEVFTLDVAGSPLMRVFLCPSGTRAPEESSAACLWRVGGDASEQPTSAPPEPQQITVHWPDAPQWPAFLAMTGAARPGRVPPGHYVAYITIIAEY